jgi:4-hydroxybenzoate polyprenyltransferase
MRINRVFTTIRHFLELIRFSHTIFALPFALLAAMMAWRLPDVDPRFPTPNAEMRENVEQLSGKRNATVFANWPEVWQKYDRSGFRWRELIAIVLCMGFARSAAMAFNRLADRRIDAANPRTKSRHLPRGDLSVSSVAMFAAACSVAFVASTTFFLPNWLPLALALPLLMFLLGYSFAKRFTALAHFWLGAALALSPMAAWIAIRGEQVIIYPADIFPAVILGAAVLTWVAGFDIIYACQDYDADRRAKLHSIPIRLGIQGALYLAAACHLLTIVLLACLPLAYPYFGWIYWAGVTAVAVLLIYEHLLVRPDDLSRVNAAFFNVNAVISLGLFAVGTLDLLVAGR